jgi:hypothetical protein
MRAHEFITDEQKQLEETVVVWKKVGKKFKPSFRCTSGPRAGRLVADLAQCGEHPDIKKSARMKVTRARTGAKAARKSKKTKRVSPASKIVRKLNLARKK